MLFFLTCLNNSRILKNKENKTNPTSDVSLIKSVFNNHQYRIVCCRRKNDRVDGVLSFPLE